MKPRYVRVNTNVLSRSDAIEEFLKDGWNQVTNEFKTYDEFLNAITNLGEFDFLSDIHVNNLFIFPSSSKRYWASNILVQESKLILQDKVRKEISLITAMLFQGIILTKKLHDLTIGAENIL